MPFETAPTYIFDLHCDTLDRLALHKTFPDAGFMEQDAAIPDARMSSLANNDCHIALDRMARAQYAWCQCFAAFIPDHMPADWGWQVFCAVRDFFQSQLAEHAALIEQVHDARDIRGIVDSGKCAGVFTVEGGSFIEGSLERLHAAADAGVKMLTLTWNGKNAIASGNVTTDGLSTFGAQVVRAMEQRRMVVDVSHERRELLGRGEGELAPVCGVAFELARRVRPPAQPHRRHVPRARRSRRHCGLQFLPRFRARRRRRSHARRRAVPHRPFPETRRRARYLSWQRL